MALSQGPQQRKGGQAPGPGTQRGLGQLSGLEREGGGRRNAPAEQGRQNALRDRQSAESRAGHKPTRKRCGPAKNSLNRVQSTKRPEPKGGGPHPDPGDPKGAENPGRGGVRAGASKSRPPARTDPISGPGGPGPEATKRPTEKVAGGPLAPKRVT